MSLLSLKPEENIDSWRQRVPSRLDREDPFEGDAFHERPSTRLTFRDASPPAHRPSTRLGFLRSATPIFSRPSTPFGRPASSMMERRPGGKHRSLLSFLNRKRKQQDPDVEMPRDPVRLNFLFVGSKAAGQTSLLFRSRYGYFPDSDGFARPLYETYVSERVYDNQPYQWHHACDEGFTKSGSFEPLLYLVGLKKDLRDQCFLEDHRTGSAHTPSGLLAYSTCCICPAEATWHAQRIGAHQYIECSAATGEGVREVIDDSGRKATRRAIGGEWPEDEVVASKKRRRFF
ncbi:hypothetical protein F66182_3681 [Fusarium sp. NRRL 66182]|nr:hypothetical protein F66182_3681 [Fusarium sp. NRRL 66182]